MLELATGAAGTAQSDVESGHPGSEGLGQSDVPPVVDSDWEKATGGQGSWDQLASLERVEVYQATGMIVAALDVTPDDALVRLRAHAITCSLTASDVACQILDRSLVLDDDDWHETGGDQDGAT